MKKLKEGDQLGTVTTGAKITVGELLGEGGQGFVYKVRYDFQGTSEDKALKWYKMPALGPQPKKFYDNLNELNRNRSNIGSDDFIWPLDIRSTKRGSLLAISWTCVRRVILTLLSIC